MINSAINILDNTGCYFISKNDYFIIGDNLAGYSNISKNYLNCTLSYLCKNKEKYEVGIGRIEYVDDKLVLKRISILLSSSNNNPIDFGSDNNNHLYSFANSYNFKTAFNNFISIGGTFNVNNIRATYLVDLSEPAFATLPLAQDNRSLVVEFKTTLGTNTLQINHNNKIICILPSNSYTKFISTGLDWLELKDNSSSIFKASSISNNYSTMSTTVEGNSGSIQYNSGSLLSGSDAYFVNNKILFGSNNQDDCFAVIPTSGNLNTIFNNTRTISDFIVKGSGDKNLFFSYDGKLGINIPSGVRPQTSLHIINNSCGEAVRLENRNQCFPASITLYHKPSILPQNNSVIASINLSCKNSSNIQADMVKMQARTLSSNANSTSGELAILVNNSGNMIENLTINPYSTNIKASNNILSVSLSGIYINGDVKWNNISTSGLLLMSDNNGNVVLTDPEYSSIIKLLEPDFVTFTGIIT